MSTVNGFQVGSETLKYNYESLDNYNTPNFSTSSSETYAVGDYVMYNGKLYKCTTATTGGTWVSGNWTEAVLSDDVSGLTRQVNDKQNKPVSEGTAGQVLGLDSSLQPAWIDQTGGGSSVVVAGEGTGSTVQGLMGTEDPANSNTATGRYAHVEGGSEDTDASTGVTTYSKNTASGDSSHAEGAGTTASGDYSHSECSGTTASGNNSHAEGAGTTASGPQSHAEGGKTIASGVSSHAEGYGGTFTISGTTYESGAKGMSDHTEGYQTMTANGPPGNHAEGYQTRATGGAAHAEGNQTTASGSNSHAEGWNTTASGNNSHAKGTYTIANHKSQHVFGEYNVADPSTAAATARGTYIEIVGNGTRDHTRSNARTLDWNGNEVLAGKLTVGAAPTADMDVATKKYVDDNAGGLPEITAADDGKIMVAKNGEWVNEDLLTVGTEHVILPETEGVSTNSQYNLDLTAFPSVSLTDLQYIAIHNGRRYELGTIYTPEGYFAVYPPDFDIMQLSEDNMPEVAIAIMQGDSASMCMVAILPEDTSHTLTLMAKPKTVVKDEHIPFAIKAGSGMCSIAEGNGTTASNAWSHAEGNSTTASGMVSHAEGLNTTASGKISHAEGRITTASGDGSHAEGNRTTASGSNSHAEGDQTTASGSFSHAEGEGSTYKIGDVTYESGAKGEADHTEGYQTLTAAVTGDGNQGNHAEGYRTKATGGAAHAEGNSTTASGGQSHAEGNRTTASGIQSHAEGYYTTANHKAQHVFGEYNVADTSTAAATARGTYIEIVGNGTSDGARSNARTLDWSGNEVLAGGLTVGAAGITIGRTTITEAQLTALLALLNS